MVSEPSQPPFSLSSFSALFLYPHSLLCFSHGTDHDLKHTLYLSVAHRESPSLKWNFGEFSGCPRLGLGAFAARTQVRSLVRKLRSFKSHSATKNKQTKNFVKEYFLKIE